MGASAASPNITPCGRELDGDAEAARGIRTCFMPASSFAFIPINRGRRSRRTSKFAAAGQGFDAIRSAAGDRLDGE
jgi:hypothetical protein